MSIDIEFDIECSKCGKELNGKFYYLKNTIEIDLCENCIKEKDDEIESLNNKIDELEENNGL